MILSFAIMAFVALIPFFGIMQLSQLIGRKQMRDLFFRKRTTFTLAISAAEPPATAPEAA